MYVLGLIVLLDNLPTTKTQHPHRSNQIFLPRFPLYFVEFIVPLILNCARGPLSAKTSMTVGMRLLPKNGDGVYGQKQFLVLSDYSTLFQS